MRIGWIGCFYCAAALLLPATAATTDCVSTDYEWLELELESVTIAGAEATHLVDAAAGYFVTVESDRYREGKVTLNSMPGDSNGYDSYRETFE